MIKAILTLPFNAAVTIPVFILWFSPSNPAGLASTKFWLAALFLTASLKLFISSVHLFVRVGKGSLAPRDPPTRLVIQGPYRYIRHPMVSGVLCILVAEMLFFGSWTLARWTALFLRLT